MNIDFDQIKIDLVSEGLVFRSHVEAATEKVLFVYGEFLRDDSVSVTRIMAGWRVAGLAKTMNQKFDELEIPRQSEERVREFFESEFPGVTVFIEIF